MTTPENSRGYPEIVFGTDGWRAVLGEGFTTDRFRAAVRAVAAQPAIAAARDRGAPVLVAHDTRFLARRFAELAAVTMAEAGYRVCLSDGPTATPGIGAAIVEKGAAFGLMITASHNPPEYLGLKLKGAYGGSATPDEVAGVQRALQVAVRESPAAPVTFPEALPQAVTTLDMNEIYVARLRRFLPLTPGDDAVVHDAMYGSGRGLMTRAMAGSGARVIEVRHDDNPGFGGHGPEPVPDRLKPMYRAVKRGKAIVGIATDGDADRVAACDAAGTFVYPHEIMALMITFLVDELGKRGDVVRNIATSELVRRVAAERNLTTRTTPVGFKHIVAAMLQGGVMLGGEESGGIAVTEHLPERDGVLCGMVLREIVLRRGRSLRALLDDLYARYGTSVYRRWDLHVPAEKKDAILEALATRPPETLAKQPVQRIDRTDGWKFWLPGDAWLLTRASGTEPIMRVYIEAADEPAVKAIYRDFDRWVGRVG